MIPAEMKEKSNVNQMLTTKLIILTACQVAKVVRLCTFLFKIIGKLYVWQLLIG